MYIAQV